MPRFTLTLHTEKDRQKASKWLAAAPWGCRLTFQTDTRTNDQNALMWDLLSDVSAQHPWHGQKLSPDDWKLIFMAALNQELRIVPNITGNGFVQLGRSSSKLSKSEMADLIELILEFCARNNIRVLTPSPTMDSPAPNKAGGLVAA